MKHLGDITKVNGAEIEPVDCVCGGSPCQDLSVAGKRAGLEGERSGLFMEQIRVIKEMRENDRRANGRTDEFIRPNWMVWENVPGALSSGKNYKGEDFQIVLEETAKIVQEDAVIPEPPKGGWSNAGCILGSNWSIAWRVHDAQFWGKTMYADGRILVPGTPQRRRRLALVADFTGHRAPEILFVRKGLQRNSEEGEQAWEGIAGDSEDGTRTTSYGIDQQGGKGNASYTKDIAPTIAGDSHGTPHGVAYEKD